MAETLPIWKTRNPTAPEDRVYPYVIEIGGLSLTLRSPDSRTDDEIVRDLIEALKAD